MTKKLELCRRLALGINSAERRCDSSIEGVADLLGIVGAVRRDGNIGAEYGQPTIEQLSLALPLLAQARAHIVRAHKLMAEAAPSIGFEPFTGEGPSKPADPPSRMAHLEIAA